MRLVRVLLVLSLWLAFNALPILSAQEPVATFSSRTELVLVPVVVHDGNGGHVPGLTANQFELLDNNKSRSLKVFEEVKPEVSTTNALRNDREFGNYVLDQKSARRVTIIVLDVLNTPRLEQLRARNAVIRYLKDHVSNTEPTSLMVLSRNGLRQIHGFSTNMEVLARSVKQAKSELSNADVGPFAQSESLGETGGLFSEVQALDQIVADKVNKGYESLKQRESINITSAAFEVIARAYTGVPGRKALLWVTGGFELPLSRSPIRADTMVSYENFEYEDRTRLEQAWRGLASANISVYPIDIIGMANDPAIKFTSMGLVMSKNDPRTEGGSKSEDVVFDPRKYHQDTYRAFATATGGSECINQNDIANCMQHAVDDSENYYLLGFYLPKEDRNTGMRKLSVKVSVPKVDLRYRKNYDSSGDFQGGKKQELAKVYSSPLDYTDLNVDVKLGDTVAKGSKRVLPVVISLPPSSFSVDYNQANLSAMEFSAAAFDSKGKAVATLLQNVRGNLKPETAALLQKSGFQHKLQLELPPGTYELKCVARDTVTGKIGSVTTQIQVN
ncbi:MAG TPA: VWA domain-containing protein [Terriglobales bacterium]|nr:VWA domain-containing protein [Terriglobales bacterium]